MRWPTLLNLAGYGLGLVGMLLGIWSPLEQGVSLIGIALVTAGYLLLLIVRFAQ
jgi:hypothetical protein